MLELANDKKTRYVIVYRKDHSKSEETAVCELSVYLEKLTGAKFDIVTDDTKKTDLEIVVGFADRPGCRKDEKLGDEGYTIKVDGRRLPHPRFGSSRCALRCLFIP